MRSMKAFAMARRTYASAALRLGNERGRAKVLTIASWTRSSAWVRSPVRSVA